MSESDRLRDYSLNVKLGTEWETDRNNYFIVIPDMEEPGRIRIQEYDRDGFSGHMVFDNLNKLVKYLATWEINLQPANGTLEELSYTSRWIRGMDILHSKMHKKNPLSPEAYSHEYQPCALVRPVGSCPDDRAGVHFATDWGIAARYAMFKASRSSSIGIVLEYDLSGLELVPDHDAFVEKYHGDDMVKDVSYYIDEFDILADPENPDYDRLADLMQSEAESYDWQNLGKAVSIEDALTDAAKGNIFMVLADKLILEPEMALKAIQDADVPLSWWSEVIGQVRTFSEVGNNRLLQVVAMKPVENDISSDDPDDIDEDACPEQIYIDDLDNVADVLADMSVVLWTSRRRKSVQEVYYHGTDLTRARVILDGTKAGAALHNPWDPCVQS